MLQFQFGNYNNKCWGNLAHCDQGLSVSIWIQVPASLPTAQSIILTSGGQAGDGFAIYTIDSHVVIVVSSNGVKQNITVDSGAFKPARWTNLAFSWYSKVSQHPLCLFVDGHQTGCSAKSYVSQYILVSLHQKMIIYNWEMRLYF